MKAVGFPEQTSATERFTASYGLAVAGGVVSAIGLAAGLPVLLVNLAAAGIVLSVLPEMRNQPAPAMRFLGHTSPLLVFYLFYRECGLILSLPGVHWRDASLGGAERALQWVSPDVPAGAGEALAAAYMSYIPFVVAAAILVARGEDGARGLETLVRRVCFAWAVCFAAFVLFPILGPRFVDATGQAALFGTGPFSALALFNQRYGMLHGGAFPSAHIAASVIALAALSPRQRLVFLPLVLSIFVSVIALRYHYRVDVAAGIVVGLGAIAFDRAFVALNAAARNPASAEPEAAKAKRYDTIKV
jgi:PAP2 superfamily